MQTKQETVFDTILKTIPPLHSEGWKFLAIFAAVTGLLGAFSSTLLWIGIILTAWCAYFFRDPVRTVPARDGLVVSPADGLVQKIETVIPPPELNLGKMECPRISIFLNVFDVHVNRIPIAGKIVSLHYHPGTFINASLDKASEQNERQMITLATKDNKLFGVVQIAGLVARRILCTLKEGQEVQTGERLGMIRFGSRVDVYLPGGEAPFVVEGQRVIGGETVLADLNAHETTARTGVRI